MLLLKGEVCVNGMEAKGSGDNGPATALEVAGGDDSLWLGEDGDDDGLAGEAIPSFCGWL